MIDTHGFVQAYTFIYVDGSHQLVDSSDVLSWAIAVFHVDTRMVHKCVFSSGGLICVDRDSPLFLGATTFNSFSAEVYANVMARLYILQVGDDIYEYPICILYDSTSAADVVSGRASLPLQQNYLLCKLGCAIDRRVCQKGSLSDHHIHSHEQHPWNEYADSICDHIAKSPSESRVSMTPLSPITGEGCFCIDLASFY